jgi:HAD superfamily hydrolase (TIGR01509 family)
VTSRIVLFDIDGTLVDSNYRHVEAWSRAFQELGQSVDDWSIHRSIGMDGELLLDAMVPDADGATRAKASELHERHYLSQGLALRCFHRARDLLRELADRGVTVVLATSAPPAELEALRTTLDVDDAVDVVTSSGDVGTAKPAPDIIHVALARAGGSSDDAVMVGDTVWDVRAAARAGVACIGLLSGGISAEELLDAGAAAVYSDVADLLERLDESPLGMVQR